MTQARKDNNQVATTLATSSTDGETPVPIQADPTTHRVVTENASTGSDLSDDIASRDDNGYTVMMAVSETDGITPVAVYINPSTKKLLIDSS